MQDFFKSGFFKILLVVMGSLVGLIVFEASTGNLLVPEQVLGTITKPFTDLATTANDSVSGFFDQVFQGIKYKEENVLLKDEIANLQKKLVEYEQIKIENQQLKDASGIKSANPSFEIEPARVVARDPDDLYTFTINVGTQNGVLKNSPVITNRGLVGIVTNVAQTYSKVTTILGLNIKISSTCLEKNEIGIVSGQADLIGDNLCAMLHLDKSTALEPEDIISTSGGGGLYPPNLIIGKVKEIRVSSNGMSAYAVVDPAEDIVSVKDVVVVKKFTGQQVLPENS